MSAENAKDAAKELVASLQLPAVMPGDKFQLVTFATEEDCRFFYPRRALQWQRQVNTFVARALRKRGIGVHRLIIRPQDYRIWRKDRDDSEESRRKFSDQYLRLLRKDC